MQVFDCPVEKIKVVDRFRKVMPSNETLKVSIQNKGIIVPLIIDEDYNLVAGERRLTVAKELKLETVPAYFRKEADELTKREIELEENVCREDFTDEERVKAVLEIHRLKQEKYGKSFAGSKSDAWTLSDTANSLGISKTLASILTQVGTHIEKAPEDEVAKALKHSAHDAYKVLLKQQADKVAQTLVEQIQAEPKMSETEAVEKASKMFLRGDCCELIKQLPPKCIDFGFTDSPYGINIQSVRKEAKEDVYAEDTPEQFSKLWEVLSKEYFRVLRDNAFLFVFCGWQTKAVIDKHLQDAGFEVCPIPFIWIRLGGSWQCNTPSKWPASAVEVATIAVKGNPMMVQQGKPNFSLATTLSAREKIHGLEKPQELIIDILNRYCIPGMTVLDTFGGSGSTVIACHELGLNGLAFELDEDFYNQGLLRLIAVMTKSTYSASEQVDESPVVGEINDDDFMAALE